MLLPATLVNAQPAFPGAQGGGAASVGGRGGTVIEVTNLNDDGPGSLRACAQWASAPRTCVFRVSGIIELTSDTIYVTNPYLTVAGQTAPGGGITLSGRNLPRHMVTVGTHDVIWRYTRIRHGYNANTPYSNGSNFTTEASAYNVIFDHNSSTWTQSEGIGGMSPEIPQYIPSTAKPFRGISLRNRSLRTQQGLFGVAKVLAALQIGVTL